MTELSRWCEALACPVCGRELGDLGATLRCSAGHAFDVAHQGYVNLVLPGTHTGTADTPEMVAARDTFFAAGHMQPLIARVAEVVAEQAVGTPGCIAEVGAGTAEYLAAAVAALPSRCGLALDISKHAARRAARAHERVGAVVCDAWGTLPVRDAAAAVVMSVFAPRNPAEFARILADGGHVVVVTPTAEHLSSLVETLGLVTVERRKSDRLEAQLSPLFERRAEETLERELALTRQEAESLVGMGPSARHMTEVELRSRLALLDEPITTRLSVSIGVWRKREAGPLLAM